MCIYIYISSILYELIMIVYLIIVMINMSRVGAINSSTFLSVVSCLSHFKNFTDLVHFKKYHNNNDNDNNQNLSYHHHIAGIWLPEKYPTKCQMTRILKCSDAKCFVTTVQNLQSNLLKMI